MKIYNRTTGKVHGLSFRVGSLVIEIGHVPGMFNLVAIWYKHHGGAKRLFRI